MIQHLVEHIVKSLVTKPELVSITMTKSGEVEIMEINVDDADRGKVIGREGQTIKTLRNIVILLSPAGSQITVDIAQDA